MRVEKIDITKELIDMPEGRDRMDFLIRKDIKPYILKQGDNPPNFSETAEKKTYIIQSCGFLRHSVKNYLVPLDDQDLFQDLIEITENMFNRAVEKKTDYYKELVVNELSYQARQIKKGIKELPWYKRLFKMF